MAHRLAPAARADLVELWCYVAEERSIETADRLVDSISARFVLLSKHPHVGRQRDDLRTGVRSFPVAEHAPEPLRRFIVQPKVSTGVPILINRATPRTGYWDDPIDRIARDDARMEFVRFFDWDELGLGDFHFVEIRIRACSKHPSLAGRYALLEFGYAQIFFDDEAAS